MKKNLSVCIIGGGFCGTMTLVQLLRQNRGALDITLIHTQPQPGRGVAYDAWSATHVLNVEARNMSAFPDEPEHFVQWLRASHPGPDPESLPFRFVPRNFFGEYLEEILDTELKHKKTGVNVNLIRGKAVDISPEDHSAKVTLDDGSYVLADRIVLATGNEPPARPRLRSGSFPAEPAYIANPWDGNLAKDLTMNDPILIIGTGLSMVDVVIGLHDLKFKGRITALSPKGFNILPHRKHIPQRDILSEIHPPYRINNLFRIFRKYVRLAWSRGESGETIVDALRSKTPEIWQQLSVQDKKSFMAHIRHLWGVARHRLPAEIHEQIRLMTESGQLEIIAGRLLEVHKTDDHVLVLYRKRKDQSERSLKVSRIINCTGPQADISLSENPLLRNLYDKGMICQDELKLGMETDDNFHLFDRDGKASEILFTLGTHLRGKYWESTAVPELRIQARRLAGILLDKN